MRYCRFLDFGWWYQIWWEFNEIHEGNGIGRVKIGIMVVNNMINGYDLLFNFLQERKKGIDDRIQNTMGNPILEEDQSVVT